MQISFSVDMYNGDGGRYMKCVMIHMEQNSVLVFNDSLELEKFIKDLQNMLPEIREQEIERS